MNSSGQMKTKLGFSRATPRKCTLYNQDQDHHKRGGPIRQLPSSAVLCVTHPSAPASVDLHIRPLGVACPHRVAATSTIAGRRSCLTCEQGGDSLSQSRTYLFQGMDVQLVGGNAGNEILLWMLSPLGTVNWVCWVTPAFGKCSGLVGRCDIPLLPFV